MPNGGGSFQDLAAYALGVQGTQQAVPATSTPEPTQTAAATSTLEPTMTVASTATVEAARPTVRPAASATATRPVPSGLPQTGTPDGTGGNAGLVLTLLALTLVALGLVTRSEQVKRTVRIRRD